MNKLISLSYVCLLGLLSLSAPANAASSAWSSAQFKRCSQKLSQSDVRYFDKNTQQQLQTLYQHNRAYQQAQKQDAKALMDGLFGPKTQRWMAYFCSEFAIPTQGSHTQFVHRLQSSLIKATEINEIAPNWRDIILPSQLLTLSDTRLAKKLSEKSKTTQTAPSPTPNTQPEETKSQATTTTTKTQTKATKPQPAADYYQLTQDDLKILSERKTALDTLAKLSAQQFDRRSVLYNDLHTQFSQLGQTQININALIESESIDNPIATKSEIQSTSTTKASTRETSQQTTSVQETTASNQTKTNAPSLVWMVKRSALKALLAQRNLVAFPKDIIKKLGPLQNEVFASTRLMGMALNLAGLSASQEAPLIESILTLAGKTGIMPTVDHPIIWHAPEGCGCKDSKESIFSADHFYGFYPYWIHPKDGTTIHFSQFDRIGLVAATLNPALASKNKLIVPPNWSTSAKESQFIQTAHRYRSKVDLVVTTPDSLTQSQLESLFTQSVIQELVDAVKQPLDHRFSNRMQPLLSFGISPVPTIADGITLDIDLSPLTTPQSQKAFLQFAQKLKESLQGSQERSAHFSDRYYLNIVIPINRLPKKVKHNFYTLANLLTLSRWTNFFIMRSAAHTASTHRSGQTTELRNIRYAQIWLNRQKNQEQAARVYCHVLPILTNTNTVTSKTAIAKLNQRVHFASWGFSGAAFWPIPLTDSAQEVVSKVYYPPSTTPSAPLAVMMTKANQLFNWVCPHRWFLRVLLLGIFAIILTILIASIWYYPWRKMIVSLPFVGVSALAIFALMLVFIADPYFKDEQGPIILGLMLIIAMIVLIVRIIRRQGIEP
ncbi:MAG: hypothetical protein CENE_01738 [Candidatus Celerinatantimonas neptuna]|nr:MAG: hypothetical protein CENE_01738 [Candidatus Celerinatantimonas neptuna]